jgi:hypothetical protein
MKGAITMNDNRLICPHCITEIDYDDLLDESFNTNTYEVNWRGTCPVCGRHFTWKEVYRYSRLDCFEEEIENG